MAFDPKTLIQVGFLNGGVIPGYPSPFWEYLSTADAIATISASGYFTTTQVTGNFAVNFQVGDTIYVSATDGFYTLQVTAITPAITTSVLITSVAAGGTVKYSVSSATPGTNRALTGKMTGTATTMTSGNLVGLRGEVDCVGASGGFLYGVQGKLIPTGSLSGSVWAAGLFGQLDISAATINAGQIAPIWGDCGASAGTLTSVTGARGIAMTNSIASLTLNSMIYLYGKATNLFELSGSSSTYISTAAGATIGGTLKKIAFTIDGVTYYLLAGTTIS